MGEAPAGDGSFRVVSPGGFVFGAPQGHPEEAAEKAEPGPPAEGTVEVPADEGKTVVLAGAGMPVSPPLSGGPSAPQPEVAAGEHPGGGATGEGSFYIPPEADYGAAHPPPVTAETSGPAEPEEPLAPEGRTVAIETVAATGGMQRRSRVICPECYASNPEENSYCQECGSLLPMAALRQPQDFRQQRPAAYQRTTVLPPAVREPQTGEREKFLPVAPAERKARTSKSFSVADALALPALALLAAALLLPSFLEGFSYKRGSDIGIFTYQGSYVRGRPDLLGGPGILPYRGTEFITVGFIAALGLGLAFLFMLIRTGRGPMYLLAGVILLLPLIYCFFQAVLPLREMGVQIEPAVGLGRLFVGGEGTPGLGPPFWMVAGAGAILVLCGFLAPPRGWGRLFSFLLFFSLATGAAFLCAACYNWNLFISNALVLGRHMGAAAMPGAVLPRVF